MNEFQKKAIVAIEAQQAKIEEDSNPWLVGEQLKDICRMEPRSAELISQDLENDAMSITAAEKRIKAFAEDRKKGTSSGVSGRQADRILRKFYGLPEAGPASLDFSPAPEDGGPIRLEDYF